MQIVNKFFLLPLVLMVATVSYGTAQKCLTNNENVGPPPMSIRPNLYQGQREFTINLLNAIQKATPNDNVFFSPYSTYHALLLAYFGSRSGTEQELTVALQLKWANSKAQVRDIYRIEKQFRTVRAKSNSLIFSSADKIFFAQHVNLSSCPGTVLHDELESLNFRENAEQSRLHINNWIANITHNEIKNMLSPGDVTSETEMILANAAHFKGQWLHQFNLEDTKNEIFYTSKTEMSFVPMMHTRGTYYLTIDERLGAHILQLPYKTANNVESTSDMSMIIILPAFAVNALEDVLAKLNPDILELALKEAMAREIEISLPKFEFEQRLELEPILRQMGINSIFDINANFGDFSTSKNLMFGEAKHVAKIKVDEEGSTASAATVLVSFRSARPVEPTKFECNHPFLFLIYDQKVNAILFTGIYRDPKTQK